MCSFVISIFLNACESQTLTAELEKGTQTFEMRCYWKLLNILYKDHVTNEGTVNGKRRGSQKRRLEDNIKEWIQMDFASSARAAEDRTRWKGVIVI